MSVITPIPEESALCAIDPSPNVITGYLMRALIRHFANPQYLKNPSLKVLRWVPDTADTRPSNILITSVNNFDPDTADKRPAIVVKSNGAQIEEPQVIGDNVQAIQALLLELGDNGLPVDPNDFATAGFRAQLHLVTGSHTLFCMSGSSGMTEDLGWESFEEMLIWQTPVIEELHLDRFRVGRMSDTKKLQENPEAFVVTVPMGYAYYRVDILRENAPLLKRVVYRNTLI